MSEFNKNKETQLSSQEILRASSELLQHFGVEVSPTEQPEEFLRALHQLNPRFQGERDLARFELEQDQTSWPEDTKDLIMRTAESMRMLEVETPLVGDFDVVIPLGAARMANYDRIKYAADALTGGKATAKHLVVGAATRPPTNDSELEIWHTYARQAENEAEACEGAAEVVAQETGIKAEVVSFEFERPDGTKAGTPDVVRAVLEKLQSLGELSENSRIAAVTTQIYQASTELDLARVAKEFGITNTFTAGNPSDPKIIEARTPATYLSEVIRTLRAATLALQAEKQ